MSSTEAWLFDDDIPVDGVGVEVSPSHCRTATAAVRDLDLAVPPVSVAVTATPGCQSPARRDPAVGAPLSTNTNVCSPAVTVSVSASSAMTLSRLDEPLPARDRRRPDSGTVEGA